MPLGRRLPWDWHDGLVPESAVLDDDCHVESSYQFLLDRSRPPHGVRVGRGSSTYGGTMFDLGPQGEVVIGRYTMTNGARFVCDERITVGDYTLLSWNVLVMDSRRVPTDPAARRAVLEAVPAASPRRLPARVPTEPVRIGSNVWVGFDAVLMPGVTVGDGAVVGARSVVWDDVEPHAVVVGNPARVVRRLEPDRDARVDTPDGEVRYRDVVGG